jgi:hypothetical protein
MPAEMALDVGKVAARGLAEPVGTDDLVVLLVLPHALLLVQIAERQKQALVEHLTGTA